jgi:hypothetical protein
MRLGRSKCTITANVTTSPDGFENADKLYKTPTNTQKQVLRNINVTAGTYTIVIFVKANIITEAHSVSV